MINQLSFLQLTENEKKVYEYLLSNGEAVASHIAKELSFDKSSTYIAIKHLNKIGLVTKHFKKRGTTYSISNPEKIKEILLEKKNILETEIYRADGIISELKRKSNVKGNKVDFVKFIGVNAILLELDKSSNCKEKVIREIAGKPYQTIIKTEIFKKYYDNFLVKKHKYKLRIKQIVSNIRKDKIELNDSSNEIYFLPKEIYSDCYIRIYDDIVEIIYEDNSDLAMIQVSNIVLSSLFKDIFEYLCLRSIKYETENKIPLRLIQGSLPLSFLGLKTNFNEHVDLSEEEVIDIFQQHLSLGINWVDTSLNYNDGKSMDILSNVLKAYSINNIAIKAKLTYPIASIKDIEKKLDMYLKAFDREYIDIFEIETSEFFHWSIEKIVKETNRLIDGGKVKYIGLKEFNIKQIKEVEKYANYGIASNEIEYNLKNMASKKAIKDYCNEQGITIIATNPYINGILPKLTDDPILANLTDKYDKPISQIILNWLSQKDNFIVQLKSNNPKHIIENCEYYKFKLTENDIEELDKWELKEI